MSMGRHGSCKVAWAGRLGAIVAALAACGCGSSGGKATGTEGGPCYPATTCNDGLVCLSSLCVRPAVPDAGGDVATDAVDEGGSPGQETGPGDIADAPGATDPAASDQGVQDCVANGVCEPGCTSDPDCPAARIRLVDQQQIGSNVLLFVSVTDPDGVGVPSLSQTDFQVMEDDAALSVESGLQVTARPSTYRWWTLVALDTSSSILDANSLASVVAGARTFAHHVTDQNTWARQVGVAAFDGALSLRAVTLPAYSGCTNDEWGNCIELSAWSRKVDVDLDRFLVSQCSADTECATRDSTRPQCHAGLCIDPSTNLNGAVIGGLNRLGGLMSSAPGMGAPRGSSLVVFSDGSDHAGYKTHQQVLDAMAQSTGYVFAIGLEGEIDRTKLSEIGRDGAVFIQSINQIDSAMEEVWQRLKAAGEGIYLVSYCTPARNGQHTITVALPGKNASVSATFSGSSDAACDPSAMASACQGMACGTSDTGYFYCGDCPADSYCSGGTCTVECTMDNCGVGDINCGGCPAGQGCAMGGNMGQCTDVCLNWQSLQSAVVTSYACGTSPNDQATDCGTCTGACVTGQAREAGGNGYTYTDETSVCCGSQSDRPVWFPDGLITCCPSGLHYPCWDGTNHMCCADSTCTPTCAVLSSSE